MFTLGHCWLPTYPAPVSLHMYTDTRRKGLQQLTIAACKAQFYINNWTVMNQRVNPQLEIIQLAHNYIKMGVHCYTKLMIFYQRRLLLSSGPETRFEMFEMWN